VAVECGGGPVGSLCWGVGLSVADAAAVRVGRGSTAGNADIADRLCVPSAQADFADRPRIVLGYVASPTGSRPVAPYDRWRVEVAVGGMWDEFAVL